MKKLVLLALGVLVISGFMAACKGGDRKEHGDWMVKMAAYKLDLNDAQKAKLEDVRKAVESARSGSEAERAREVGLFKAQILGDSLDPQVAKDLIEAREAKIDQNFDAVFAKVQAFHASLTLEQKKKAVEMVDRFAHHDD